MVVQLLAGAVLGMVDIYSNQYFGLDCYFDVRVFPFENDSSETVTVTNQEIMRRLSSTHLVVATAREVVRSISSSERDFVLNLNGEGYAVNFENRYRRSVGADIRSSYDSSFLNPILDFDVDLFPPE